MKDELIITLKATNNSASIMNFVAAVNKTDSLSALVLPNLDEQNCFQINVYKIGNE